MKISKDHLKKCCDSIDSYEQNKDKHKHSNPNPVFFEKALARNILEGNIHGDAKNLINRKKNIESNAPEPTDFALERAIGKNDAVYSNFIDLIVESKKKVGRIIIKNGVKLEGYATGFMVSENLLLTNHHVFKNRASVMNSVVEFYYEYDFNGFPKPTFTHKLNINKFFYANEALDYCLVGVEEKDMTAVHSLKQIGFITLEKISGKLGEIGKERLNIIHHPGGDLKQLSIRANQYSGITPTTILYKSDTAQGSSGSPVFNDQFQLVGLHHGGKAARNQNGEVLDKNGNVLQAEEDGTYDDSKILWESNEGIRISVIRKHIESLFPNDVLIRELLNPHTQGTSVSTVLNEETNHEKGGKYTSTTIENDRVRISFPSSLLNNNNISVNLSSVQASSSAGQAPKAELDTGRQSSLEEESLRLERSMDYSACKGYQTDFIGVGESIGIPKPKKKFRKQMAKINNGRAYILKYHKYSVIQNASKKMPFISAVNINGDEALRLDESSRRDKWIRDNRIDLTVQIDNSFYSNSGFDRGHMSRREDANWGEDAAEAKRNADLTCVHTNACPQVPNFNRSGVWGKMEKAILERGAEREQKGLNKISVFNGPIFKDDDPKRQGVQIPMSFYKVILWPSDEGELKATAFIVSQEKLVGGIDFDLEDLAINDNLTFKEYQCSLDHLEQVSDIDFSELKPYDTFDESQPMLEIENERHFLELLAGSKRKGN